MYGALPPNSVLPDANSCSVLIVPTSSFRARTACRCPFSPAAISRRCAHRSSIGLHRPARRPREELPRPADLVLGIGDHLVQLRDPADRAGEREDRGEERHRDADRLLHDARIEVDVRIELARHEIVVLERDLLERHRELEQRIVAEAELAQHFVARLAHQLRARVVVLVDAVAEAHQLDARVLVLDLAR